jgi:hypothetical protein
MVRCAPYIASIAAPSTCADECQNTCDMIGVKEGMRGSKSDVIRIRTMLRKIYTTYSVRYKVYSIDHTKPQDAEQHNTIQRINTIHSTGHNDEQNSALE